MIFDFLKKKKNYIYILDLEVNYQGAFVSLYFL